MKKLDFLIVIFLFTPLVNAYASDTALKCTIKDDFADVLRETNPNFGVNVYSINYQTKKIIQKIGINQNKKINFIKINDIEILFTQNGEINYHDLSEKINTSINRINGKFIQYSEYFDENNQKIQNEQLDEKTRKYKIIATNDKKPILGECVKNVIKF